jgi:diacylglycerol kinase family enzyme
MNRPRPIWLVNNPSSGSNDDAALQALEACCGEHGFRVAHRTAFPAQDLPSPAMLDAGGIDRVAVFAGDGTINSLLGAVAGWSGAVLVLRGGTMNLLYHRLHGERTMEQVIEAVAKDEAVRRRPGVIRCPFGTAYAGMLAGPGTSWGKVREAMREGRVVELAAEAMEAARETLAGDMIACREPVWGRPEGYPLVSLTPHDDGMEVEAYHAESAGEYAVQALALLRRNFREGPHDDLGMTRTLRLASTEGQPFGLLVDGELVEAAPEVEFTLAECEVDLLATEADGD